MIKPPPILTSFVESKKSLLNTLRSENGCCFYLSIWFFGILRLVLNCRYRNFLKPLRTLISLPFRTFKAPSPRSSPLLLTSPYEQWMRGLFIEGIRVRIEGGNRIGIKIGWTDAPIIWNSYKTQWIRLVDINLVHGILNFTIWN